MGFSRDDMAKAVERVELFKQRAGRAAPTDGTHRPAAYTHAATAGTSGSGRRGTAPEASTFRPPNIIPTDSQGNILTRWWY
mmetsp:Transcript_12797/g.37626  ORF Transcript_12797/g.37626 Transcript_12797/m.37626 type:complete len:81 (-) Transcript_12797:170-412(-)